MDPAIQAMKSAPGLWYLGTPYSKWAEKPGGLEAAFVEACKAKAYLLKNGVKNYCPIAETHPVCEHAGMDHLDGEFWQDSYEPVMEACVGLCIVCMDGWQESAGLAKEGDWFTKRGKFVTRLQWPILEG